MAVNNVPALLVSDIVNVGWLTGFSGTAGLVVVTENDARFITDSRYTLQAGEEVKNMPTVWFASPVQLNDFVATNLAEMGIKKLGFESSQVTYATYEAYRDSFAGVELVALKDFVSPLRMIKSPDEIAKIRAACGVADACFSHVLRMIKPGVTEYDVMLDMEFFMRRQGAGIAFDIIAVSGHRSARPHGHASEKKLENGDFFTLDFGATVDGYHSDMTRTVVVGEASDRTKTVYNQVLKAQLAAMEMMRPGVQAKAVDARAREVFDEIGLAKFFGHGLGHGLGRLVHDAGRLASTSTDVLEVGQVWTVEPGVYIEGFGGCRIEDDVVITESGIDILNTSTKELLELK